VTKITDNHYRKGQKPGDNKMSEKNKMLDNNETYQLIDKNETYQLLDKKGTYQFLDECDIVYECYEHGAAFTIEEMDSLNLPHKELVVKNLFLRDDKKKNFYLVTLPGYKSADLKRLSEQIPSRKLSFASEDDLSKHLMLGKGHVTPIGVLNNAEKNVTVVFDRNLQEQQIGIHPMENTATIFLKFEDVKKLIEHHGNPIVLCDM
jgi:Ala-tRNA(Pro) deacylase